MTASVESLGGKVVEAMKREGATFRTPVAPGVVDFELDGLVFRVVILADAEAITGIDVWRDEDVTEEDIAEATGMTEAEFRAYAGLDEEPHEPTQAEKVDIEESFKAASDFEGYDQAQAAGREDV